MNNRTGKSSVWFFTSLLGALGIGVLLLSGFTEALGLGSQLMLNG